MPVDERCRLDCGEGLALVEPAPEPHQGKAGGISGTTGSGMTLLVQDELCAQEEVFRCEYRSWTQTEAQETNDIDQQC
jgi:hypothetical protein